MDRETTVTYHEEKGLSIGDVEALVFGRGRLNITAESLQKVDRSYDFLREFSKDKVIYGGSKTSISKNFNTTSFAVTPRAPGVRWNCAACARPCWPDS